IKGIKSSGKASYFLGVFPYIILIILLIRAVTLPGAIDGIIYFFKPQWDQLLNPSVWYAAVTQVFFSLAICFGTLITYASYNNFNRDVKNKKNLILGVACGQVMATGFSLTYYSSIMALTFRFLIASFSSVLPYSYCWPEWGMECLDDVLNPHQANSTNVTGKSPAELYFLREVLKEKSSIQDGIGCPEWSL
uniref:Sodium-dependent nutrient amino acid transporter 1 n=1 Tax=Megaselia scalaris TaxID=36166 RepID=T1GE70_MEGSC